jgi:Fe-S oxidoreductase
MNKFRYRLEKKAKQSTKEYPVATIAFYGPTADFASKAVVAVFLKKDEDEPAVLERLFSETTDARFDEPILEKILSVLETNGVKSVAMIDGVFGCPHEEGTDYPEGKPCPQCPYWAGRDRSTLARIQ